ncbi:MAG: hypothetical protein ABGX82_03560 [Pseudomonas sp.]|uniref:hypothetical protein n=1 Tax=Pseudomonas sp. TaxID=306 RepID=UPI0032424D1F
MVPARLVGCRWLRLPFRPLEQLITQANQWLGIDSFPLTERVSGYWDRADVEIDLVAMNEVERRVRFGTCKRSADKLPGSIAALKRAADRFLAVQKRFAGWSVEYAAIAPTISDELRRQLEAEGVVAQSLTDLIAVYHT